QHVGNPGRRAAIVLQDEELVRAGPDQVDSDDVRVDAARRSEAGSRRQIGRVAVDDLRRNHPRLDDLATLVDVAEEEVQGARPLPDALLDPVPFLPGEYTRNDIEGNQALGFGGFAGLAVDGER